MFQYYKEYDENLAWQTPKTEESKSYKENFFPTHTVNAIEL